LNVPEGLRYTEEHEWIEQTGDGDLKVGITDYAQDQLGDVVFVELPEVGSTVEVGAILAEVESTKSVAEVYAPVAGTVAAANTALVDDPSLVNTDPYGDGWFVTLTPAEALAPDAFLGPDRYRSLVE
jgi:glycine cleavage system H protein